MCQDSTRDIEIIYILNIMSLMYTKPNERLLRFNLTQSKSKTIITRSMLTISLIVFTDKLQGHVYTFYSK